MSGYYYALEKQALRMAADRQEVGRLAERVKQGDKEALKELERLVERIQREVKP